MKCPACPHENPPEALFCMKCGTKLERRCSRCGAAYPEEAHFCMECGEKLAEDTAPIDKSTEEAAPEAERRQLTVMFCDLVGSTSLSERLDPEDLRQVVRAYQAAAGQVVRRFEGHVAQYLGDGLLVYFGYPVAHEDDAQRAARAGLGIVEAIEGLNPRLRGQWQVELAVRVGIHTGLVVAGEIGDEETREHLAMGETPNLAARLQDQAPPNGVVVSAATHRLIEGYFACESLGSRQLKGTSQPIGLYQVRQESTARSRLDAAAAIGLTPLVGRGQEIGLLCERWAQVEERLGQVVLLSGEAGIGKSRLVQVLQERVAENPQGWLVPCQCSAYHRNSAFYPIIDVLERVTLQFEREEEPSAKLGKLEGFLVQYGFSLPETVPLFALLLSLPLDDRYAPLELSPDQQKQQLFRALVSVLLAIAGRQPLLLAVEDLHWADPTTREFLDLLVDQVPTARLLVLCTFRPDFDSPWHGRSHLTSLTLHRLNQEQVEEMVRHVTQGKDFPAEVLAQIAERTDGVPLFVEELTKMVLESGLLVEGEEGYELRGPLPPLAIPTTLQDSLMARLDRLASVKEVVQLGAVLGREFSYELLHAVSSLEEEVLQEGLGQLVEAELLYQRGVLPQATFLFKHALIQEAAYQSLLRSTRQQYHQRIARVLESCFPELAETQPEQVAYHYTEAGLGEEAIPYWQSAGQRALDAFANEEAIAHLGRGLELVAALPETAERDRRELSLQIPLSMALGLARGHTVPEVGRTLHRAEELCRRFDDTAPLVPVLFTLGMHTCLFRGEYRKMHELGERLLKLGRDEEDAVVRMMGHALLAASSYWLGEFAAAREHAEAGLALFDRGRYGREDSFYVLESRMYCLMYRTLSVCLLGYPDRALEVIRQMESLSREVSRSPFAANYTSDVFLHTARALHFMRRELREARGYEEALVKSETERGSSLWSYVGKQIQGEDLIRQGEGEAGIRLIRQALADMRATGVELGVLGMQARLAYACMAAGRIEEALQVVDEALGTVEKNGERASEASLHRQKGELLLLREPPDEEQAERSFRRALDVAGGQCARWPELGATVSLSRLWQRQGKREEAYQALREIYDWFTEGFDTPDLQDAKALLDELSCS